MMVTVYIRSDGHSFDTLTVTSLPYMCVSVVLCVSVCDCVHDP